MFVHSPNKSIVCLRSHKQNKNHHYFNYLWYISLSNMCNDIKHQMVQNKLQKKNSLSGTRVSNDLLPVWFLRKWPFKIFSMKFCEISSQGKLPLHNPTTDFLLIIPLKPCMIFPDLGYIILIDECRWIAFTSQIQFNWLTVSCSWLVWQSPQAPCSSLTVSLSWLTYWWGGTKAKVKILFDLSRTRPALLLDCQEQPVQVVR